MAADAYYKAIKLLARAKVERDKRSFDRAIDLLDQVVALGESDEQLRRGPLIWWLTYPCTGPTATQVITRRLLTITLGRLNSARRRSKS